MRKLLSLSLLALALSACGGSKSSSSSSTGTHGTSGTHGSSSGSHGSVSGSTGTGSTGTTESSSGSTASTSASTGSTSASTAASTSGSSGASTASSASSTSSSTGSNTGSTGASGSTASGSTSSGSDSGSTSAGSGSNSGSTGATASGSTSAGSSGGSTGGCTQPSDCPGTDDDCQQRTCDQGVCGTTFTGAGTAITAQNPGDCQKIVCAGDGGVTSINDDNDLPNDGNPCTIDLCTSGVPTHTDGPSGVACGGDGGLQCNNNGQCVGCVGASDCPGTDTDCLVRACDNSGVCGFSATAFGTATTAQVAGDCLSSVCAGDGGVTTVALDSDIRDGGNPCITDGCSGGVPTQTNVGVDTACGTAMICDGQGACVGCITGSDCPGSDTDCAQRACNSGVCGTTLAGSGTVVSTGQSPGDCQQLVCAGDGGITSIDDNSDKPTNPSACVAGTCSNGNPGTSNLASGATCSGPNGANLCDGQGNCVQCNQASDCGTSNGCRTFSCVSGTCSSANAIAGTVVSNPVAGDCHSDQCDGNGNLVSNAVDDSDLPADDGNVCTGETCNNGAPAHPDKGSGTPCGGTNVCDGTGACVACLTSAQCGGSTPLCDTASHTCVACLNSTQCSTPTPLCSNTTHTCVQCFGAGDCGTNNDCATNACVANSCTVAFTDAGIALTNQNPGDCQTLVCDGDGGVNSIADNSDVPNDSNPCTNDLCVGGVPSHNNVATDVSCGSGMVCDGNGACVGCVLASDCPGSDGDCTYRTCNGNVCGTALRPAGTVIANQQPGDCQKLECSGTSDIPVGVEDDSDTPADDGNPCTSDVCIAGAPAHPSLPDGTSCGASDNICFSGACDSVPSVTATDPADGSSPIASSPIIVSFSEAMNPSTLTAQTSAGTCSNLNSIQVSLDGFQSCIAFSASAPAMSGSNTIATLTPAPGLLVNGTYQIRVTPSAAAATGVALAATYTGTGFTTTSPNLCDGSLVISQVYGGGGNSGAAYKNDFIELHNRGTTAMGLSGFSVQYASGTGNSWQVTNLGGSIAAGGYYLIQEAAGADAGFFLPLSDVDAGTGIAMASGSGKVALVSATTALTGTCPTTKVVDFVGYGTVNCSDGSGDGGTAAPLLTNTTAAIRDQAGCSDVNNNTSDFAFGPPNPRNGSTAVDVCACTVENESNTALEADYCTIQSPLSLPGITASSAQTVYGQVYEPGQTGSGSQNPLIRAQLGYGPTNANPEYSPSWTWTNASYNSSCSTCGSSNDEYMTTFSAPAIGTYGYVYRFSLDQGVSWTTCDVGGAGSNLASLTFDFANEAPMTVTQ